MSIKVLVFDFSQVILFPADLSNGGKLNELHKKLSKTQTNYNVFEHFRLDTKLLSLLKSMNKNVKLYVFTNGVMHEVPEIRKELNMFSALYSANEVGYKKDDPKAFTKLAGILHTPPNEILFFDDTLENVEAARKAGLNAEQYLSVDKLRGTLGTYGIF